MPLAFDPQQTADFWLASDAAKPEESRPTFELRFVTCRQLRRIQTLRTQASAERDNDRCDALINEALGILLAGWRNIPVTFAQNNWDDVLTLGEKWEILNDGPGHVMGTERDRKNEGSRQRSDGAKSAATALVAGASIAPASPSPSNSGSSAQPAAGTTPSAPPASTAAGGVATS